MPRPYPQPVIDHLAAGGGWQVHELLWLNVRDRANNARIDVGLWSGPDQAVITVDGENRTYYGMGALLSVDDPVSAASLQQIEWGFQVSSLNSAAVNAIRNYDARLGRVERHWYWHDPLTGLPIAPPWRVSLGVVQEVSLPTPPEGGDAVADVTCSSAIWQLTRGLTLMRSDAALRARKPGDGLRKYNDISGSVQVAWGEKVKGPSADSAPPSARSELRFGDGFIHGNKR